MKWMAALLLALVVNAGTAKADTDYGCLNACVNEGGVASACIKKCAYGTTPKKTTPSTDPFSVPKPSNQIVVPMPSVATEIPKDYNCLNACLQDKRQYQYCEQTCQRR